MGDVHLRAAVSTLATAAATPVPFGLPWYTVHVVAPDVADAAGDPGAPVAAAAVEATATPSTVVEATIANSGSTVGIRRDRLRSCGRAVVVAGRDARGIGALTPARLPASGPPPASRGRRTPDAGSG